MPVKKLITCFLLLYFACQAVAQSVHRLEKQISIIPQPMSVKETSGDFIIGKKTKIYVDDNDISYLYQLLTKY